MTTGCDYSFARPDPGQLAARGYRFACRYLAPEPNTKNLTAAEATALAAAGLAVVTVWESTAQRARDGAQAGHDDGIEAARQAQACGQPPSTVIHWAVDYDAPPSDWPSIAAYSDAFRDAVAHGNYRARPYCKATLLDQLVQDGHCDAGWQTIAWSGGVVSPNAAIYQNGQSDLGGQIDVDVALHTDYGAWAPGSSPTPAPIPTPQPVTLPTGEPGMTLDLHVPIGPDGRGHAPVPGVPAKKVSSLVFNGALDAAGNPLERTAPTWDRDDVGGQAQINVYGSAATGGFEDCTVWYAT